MLKKIIIPDRSFKKLLREWTPSLIIIVLACAAIYIFADPAPPKRLVIATGDGEGDYDTYAKLYKDTFKENGIDLIIRPSSGAQESLRELQDPKSDVGAAFVQDGLGSQDAQPDVSSLGSLYYEPVWIFYHGHKDWTRLAHLDGRKIAIGEQDSGTHQLALRLLKTSGITAENATLVSIGEDDAVEALKKDQVDVAIFIATPEDDFIKDLIHDPELHLMSLDQAEALSRQAPFLHHLVLPHGTMDIKKGLPEKDIDMVAPTATLLVKDSLHPALSYLLLKAASQIHSDPGIFEARNEFPIDKDFEFSISEEARTYYRSGTPFWMRYLPFWLATLVGRFLFLGLPVLALVIPIVKAVPQYFQWRAKNRIYQRYGELKFLETQIHPSSAHEKYEEYLQELDKIEERVNEMDVPLDFSDYVYDLREHIHFVRERLNRLLKGSTQSQQQRPLPAPR